MEQKEFEKFILYVLIVVFFTEQLPFDMNNEKKHQSPHIPEENRTSAVLGVPTYSMSITASPSQAPDE
ncbi:MAG: hypothetical protein WCV59_00905 [Parcubacteria group bacterium]|jgi:hypothetical protein